MGAGRTLWWGQSQGCPANHIAGKRERGIVYCIPWYFVCAPRSVLHFRFMVAVVIPIKYHRSKGRTACARGIASVQTVLSLRHIYQLAIVSPVPRSRLSFPRPA